MRLGIWIMLGIGAILVVAGVSLAFVNPTIDHTDDGTYECFAPYDTILLGTRDDVGMHTDSQDIEDRCYSANRDRFVLASLLTAAGAVIAGAGATVIDRRRRAA